MLLKIHKQNVKLEVIEWSKKEKVKVMNETNALRRYNAMEKILKDYKEITKRELIDIGAKINYPFSTKKLIRHAQKLGIRVNGI
ncbi:MAG: hypothetical protein N2486_01980 [Caloramator sp.]|nr:hypothetical protein [Caloramator sp.]